MGGGGGIPLAVFTVTSQSLPMELAQFVRKAATPMKQAPPQQDAPANSQANPSQARPANSQANASQGRPGQTAQQRAAPPGRQAGQQPATGRGPSQNVTYAPAAKTTSQPASASPSNAPPAPPASSNAAAPAPGASAAPHAPAAQTSGAALEIGGRVAQVQGKLVLEVAGQRVPLETLTASGAARPQLQAGQEVRAQFTESQGRTIIRLLPAQEAPPANSAGLARANTELPQNLAPELTRALRTLGLLSRAPEALRLMPEGLPKASAAARAVLTLLASRGTISRDLNTIATLLNEAAASGRVNATLGDRLTAVLRPFVSGDAGDFERALRAFSESQTRGPESRLAEGLARGDMTRALQRLEGELRTELQRIAQDKDLTLYLRTRGQLRAFRNAADSVMERITATQTQNARAPEQPYLFLEMPFPPGAPIEHAQIHVFTDGRPGAGNTPGGAAEVMLDVSTGGLGDLWAHLRAANGTCACSFRVTEPHTAALVEQYQDELVAGLREAGYEEATVQVQEWDGDRIALTAQAMGRFANLSERA